MRPGVLGFALALTLFGLSAVIAAPSKKVEPQRYTEAEARRVVRMLDFFYQTNVKTLHQYYAEKATTLAPAGAVTREIMRDMNEKGWPWTHWLSVNGQALNPANRPKDEFGRRAAGRIRRGAKEYSEIEDGFLRAVTRVEITGACIRCHFGSRESHFVCAI